MPSEKLLDQILAIVKSCNVCSTIIKHNEEEYDFTIYSNASPLLQTDFNSVARALRNNGFRVTYIRGEHRAVHPDDELFRIYKTVDGPEINMNVQYSTLTKGKG